MANCKTVITLCEDKFISCGDYGIELDEMLTTDLSGATTLKEFNDIIHSELIDVKGWKTESSYPTLRLLYDRYMNSTNYCSTLSSQFDYCDMIEFSELVGTYWVDLIEQVVPSTTIWGATYVYSNTLYDQQKFKYKKYTLFGCSLPNYEDDVVSPTSGWTDDTQYTWEELPNNNYDDVSGSTTGETFVNLTYNRAYQPNQDDQYNDPKSQSSDPRNPTIDKACDGVGIIQINCGSEFIGKFSIMGTVDPDDPRDNEFDKGYQTYNTE